MNGSVKVALLEYKPKMVINTNSTAGTSTRQVQDIYLGALKHAAEGAKDTLKAVVREYGKIDHEVNIKSEGFCLFASPTEPLEFETLYSEKFFFFLHGVVEPIFNHWPEDGTFLDYLDITVHLHVDEALRKWQIQDANNSDEKTYLYFSDKESVSYRVIPDESNGEEEEAPPLLWYYGPTFSWNSENDFDIMETGSFRTPHIHLPEGDAQKLKITLRIND